jgi:AcrR family transcriptional regulator
VVISATEVAAPPRRRSQAERRADSRQRLLDAAIACLAEGGYARTTFSVVLARAGLSNGAMWKHFPTKAALFTAAIAETASLGPGRAQLDQLAGSADDARLDAFVVRLCEFACSPHGQAAVELLRAGRTDPELRAALDATDHASADRFFAAAREWVGPRVASRPDFETCARWLALATYGLAVTRGGQLAPPVWAVRELQQTARRVFGV